MGQVEEGRDVPENAEYERRCVCEHDAINHVFPFAWVEQDGRYLLRLTNCVLCECNWFSPRHPQQAPHGDGSAGVTDTHNDTPTSG